MEDTCREYGRTIEFDKSEIPTTAFTFLGIKLDTVALELRLRLSKLEQLKSILFVWRGRSRSMYKKRASFINWSIISCL